MLILKSHYIYINYSNLSYKVHCLHFHHFPQHFLTVCVCVCLHRALRKSTPWRTITSNKNVLKKTPEQSSIFRTSSIFVSTRVKQRARVAHSSGPRRRLPAQLWLPLAVPPCFLATAHHDGLALPALSHPKKAPKYNLKPPFLDLNVDKTASTCLPANIRHHWAEHSRGLLTFRRWLCVHHPHQSPNLGRLRLLPSNPCKKGHFHVCCICGGDQIGKAKFLSTQRAPNTPQMAKLALNKYNFQFLVLKCAISGLYW